ncbi:hypothetical protein EKO27_g5921 [Xylaria grammica]|uniref:FAD-binding domain-containing protein n=1 Tax=Xylaria grammica TaxID=363999 RepID=A0A439D446_9PEZI|nr:hypothetical protein EKO27_g5921 [Xylaria grammica]
MASLKVLIVGGGITGPAAAYWLSRIPGAQITLLERSSQMRASGQQLDLRVAGVDMMKKMGIEPAVRAVRCKEPGAQLVDTDGNTKAYFPAAEHGKGKQSITSEYEIMRGDLVRILYGLTENRANVRHVYNRTVANFTQDDESDPHGKVHVTFSDGRQEDFDLVLAADGTGSKTRKIMLGPDAPDPRHRTGGYIAYFSVPSEPWDSDRSTGCILPGGRMSRIIMTRKDCPELTRVYMMLGKRDEALDAALKSGDLAALKRAFAEIYEGGGWETKRFMEALSTCPEAGDLYCTPYEEVRLPEGSWSRGRAVLIGDAAHSATANGYGTSWGLIGPYLLAGELATLYEKDGALPTASVVRAAKEYEKIWRPVALSGHGGSQFGEALFPRSEFGISILNWVVGVAAWLRLDQYVGLDGFVGSWKLPDYPALDKDPVSE